MYRNNTAPIFACFLLLLLMFLMMPAIAEENAPTPGVDAEPANVIDVSDPALPEAAEQEDTMQGVIESDPIALPDLTQLEADEGSLVLEVDETMGEDSEPESAGELPHEEPPLDEPVLDEPPHEEPPLEVIDAAIVAGEPRVEVVCTYGGVLVEGEKVRLEARVYNIPEETVLSFQWQNNASGEYRDVPDATEQVHEFYVDASNSGCEWRVLVEGRGE